MNKRVLVTGVVLAIGAVTLTGVGVSCLSGQSSSIASDKKDWSELPVSKMEGCFTYDPDNIKEAVGIADYVFLGEVTAQNETTYEDVVMTEGENGEPVELSTPYTGYSIQVKENIKGKLKTDSPIDIKKDGGVSQDGDSLVIFDDDCLPEEGKEYIFLAYAQPDGSLLVSGPNSNVLDKNNTTKAADAVVEKYKNAASNEVVEVDRERYSSDYEE